MRLEIRPYRAGDETQVLELWQRCELVVPWNDPRHDIAVKQRVQPELFLVGEWDGQVVTTVMAGFEGHRGWINYLAVSPDCRRRSFGKEMMAAAEAALSALGCPKINLQVRTSNSSVIAFYRSLGYEVDDVVSLGKRLRP